MQEEPYLDANCLLSYNRNSNIRSFERRNHNEYWKENRSRKYS